MRRFLIPLLLVLTALPALAQTRAEIRDRVFLAAQSASATAAGKALAQAASRIAAGSADLAALLRDRQDSLDRMRADEERLAVVALGTGSAADREIADLQGRIGRSKADLAAFDARLAAEFPEFRELTNPRPMTVAEVQAALRPDEAVLLSLTDGGYFYLWAVSKTDVGWHRASIGRDAIAERVQTLRAQLNDTTDARAGVSLKEGGIARGGASFARGIAYQLYLDLFAPLEPVFGRAGHLMIVLDGPLTSLPPAVLVTREPQGADDDPRALRDTEWMLKRHAITTLPSVSALRVLRRPHPPPQRRVDASPFVGFGDPLFGYRLAGADPLGAEQGVYTRGIYEDVTRVADLSPLPNTARELRTLAATMGAGDDALYLGAYATEEAVKNADLSQADVVAFATHGLLADGLPGLAEPALVFTPPAVPSALDDALLTASEAASLKLSASLVILSACDTAGSNGKPGAEGLSGLARAFIYAGARAILVSHWPVDDYAARALTTGMLDRMYGDRHMPRAQALRESALELMADASDPRYAHPRLWAPFVVVGEGGAD
jgi:CHAT domain-containing protein